MTSSISQGRPQKKPVTKTAETIARHDEKTSAGRAKMLSGGDTGDRLPEVDEVLGCMVVQTDRLYQAV